MNETHTETGCAMTRLVVFLVVLCHVYIAGCEKSIGQIECPPGHEYCDNNRADANDVSDAQDSSGDADQSSDPSESEPEHQADNSSEPTGPDEQDEVIDCDNLPQPPFHATLLEGLPTSESFDIHGEYLFSSAGFESSLLRTSYDGTSEMITPNAAGWVRGILALSNGHYAVVDQMTNNLVLVSPNGGSVLLLTEVPGINDLVEGEDGLIYVSATPHPLRVDPATQVSEQLTEFPTAGYDGITILEDGTLFVNLVVPIGNSSQPPPNSIYRMYFDQDGNAGQVDLLAHLDQVLLVDGMTADVCGNLYVSDMQGKVWRVSPSGDAEIIFESAEDVSITSVKFGTDLGGWDRKSLYVVSIGRGYYELQVGVPGRKRPTP